MFSMYLTFVCIFSEELTEIKLDIYVAFNFTIIQRFSLYKLSLSRKSQSHMLLL